jgi:hypothetical protein
VDFVRETSMKMYGQYAWHCRKRYWIQDGFLMYELPSESETYQPMKFPEVLTEFAKINVGDTEAVLHFAEKWGELGYPIGTSDLGPPVDDDDPGLQDWLANGTHKPIVIKEPLKWVWKHATVIHTCLTILDYLQYNKSGLDDYLRSLAVIFPPGSLEEIPSKTIQAAGGVLIIELSPVGPQITLDSAPGDHGWPHGDARYIIQKTVNDAVLGHSVLQEPMLMTLEEREDSPHFFLVNRFHSLLQIIYWHLGILAVNGIDYRIARCEADDCGKFFVQRNRKQRFCPPSDETLEYAKRQGKRAESRCAARAKMRRIRYEAKGGLSNG